MNFPKPGINLHDFSRAGEKKEFHDFSRFSMTGYTLILDKWLLVVKQQVFDETPHLPYSLLFFTKSITDIHQMEEAMFFIHSFGRLICKPFCWEIQQ